MEFSAFKLKVKELFVTVEIELSKRDRRMITCLTPLGKVGPGAANWGQVRLDYTEQQYRQVRHALSIADELTIFLERATVTLTDSPPHQFSFIGEDE